MLVHPFGGVRKRFQGDIHHPKCCAKASGGVNSDLSMKQSDTQFLFYLNILFFFEGRRPEVC